MVMKRVFAKEVKKNGGTRMRVRPWQLQNGDVVMNSVSV